MLATMENQDKELAGIILRSTFAPLLPEEQQRLDAYLQASEANRQQYRQLTDPAYMETALQRMEQFQSTQGQRLEQILQQVQEPATPRVRRMPAHTRWAAAAAILLLIAGGTWYWQHAAHAPAITAALPGRQHDVAPGKQGAILTLADGRQLTLDSLGNGVIATQNGASIALQKGQLNYQATGNNRNSDSYNTMRTPKGRQFTVILPDGTRVWLNAASSLTYPTAFSGNQRRVKLSGEAFFEVAGNARQPFIVDIAHGSAVEVLGTSFNINAYADETTVKTTLFSGSVRTGGVVLHPGQQADQQPGAAAAVHSDADLDKVAAWKNGHFDFTDAGLHEVMRQLERWYNIEVVYEPGVPETYFYGKVSRDLPLSGILKVLQATHVHFRIEDGNRLVVMP